MSIATSIFLIAAGAILRYAVTFSLAGVDIRTVGLILIVAGVLGLVVSLILVALESDRAGRGPGNPPRY